MADERDLNAAERAIGHAPTGGETPADRAAREAWERRLSPLLTDAPAAEPPTDMMTRIEAQLDNDAPADTAEVIQLRRSVGRWRGFAGIAVAAAAALAIYVAVPQTPAPVEAAKYVAVVTADDSGQTGLLIHFDTGSGVATVIPAGARPPDGSSYEMWHLPEGATTPVSLGLLPQNAVSRATISAGEGDLFAISLEPLGGSPTGQPTQAVYHGTVVRVE